MAAYPNDSRFPGQGDLPGDNTNPNSPNYVAPAFDQSDAIRNVLDDEAEELAAQLIEALPALRWIAQNVELPRIVGSRFGNHYVSYRADFASLLTRAESLRKAVDDELEALNGRAA